MSEYCSQGVSQTSLLLYLTSLTPDSGSSAVSVSVTRVEVVVRSPLLMTIEPFGGVLSFGPLASAMLALKSMARESSKSIRTAKKTTLFSILRLCFEECLELLIWIVYLFVLYAPRS